MSDTVCLPVEVFEGAGGDLIILQEFPGLHGEAFVRVFINMDEAEKLCSEIMSVARQARSK
jgi:hypothetical protein